MQLTSPKGLVFVAQTDFCTVKPQKFELRFSEILANSK